MEYRMSLGSPNLKQFSGMGANGSSVPMGAQDQAHHDSVRLKSRSQSSSALHSNRTSNNNAIGHSCGKSKTRVKGQMDEIDYYSINNGGSYVSCREVNGLASSIPGDLWDLPPNSQSYSPTRFKKKNRSQQGHEDKTQEPQTRRQRILQMPVLEALINLSRRGDRKTSVRQKTNSEPEKMNSRSKLYAASCPDVTQHGNDYICAESTVGVCVDENLRISQPYLSHESRNSIIQRNQSLSSHPVEMRRAQQPESWTELHQHRQESRQEKLGNINQSAMSLEYLTNPAFSFITEDNIFEVALVRDSRGLGLGFSVSGGSDSEEPYAGLIRVKKVFPMGPAFQSGKLKTWDLILKANGVQLIGLTNHEALEVLRTTPTETILTVCRPQPITDLLATTESHFLPETFQRTPCPVHPHQTLTDLHQVQRSLTDSFSSISSLPSFKSKSLSSLKIPANTTPEQKPTYGEFEIYLDKIGGSLGFTLRQDDSSILGHYVRDLVKEPALGDGRIEPGDRIISVNSVKLEGMSHSEAVAFLRSCPTRVKLRLYRDMSPTPISSLSPPETHRVIKDKIYRQEAIDMIHELKERKAMSASPDMKHSSTGSGISPGALFRGFKHAQNDPATLPRRRPQHAGLTPSPQVLSAALDRFAGRSTPKLIDSPELSRQKPKEFGSNKNCPAELRSSGSGESTPAGSMIKQTRQKSSGKQESESSFDESCRKPSFRQYTMHLDRISSFEDESFSSDLNQNESIVSAPTFGFADGGHFQSGQPAYASAIIPNNRQKARCKKNLSLSREEMEQYRVEALRIGSNLRIPNNDSPTMDNFSHEMTSIPQMTFQRSPNEGTRSKPSEDRVNVFFKAFSSGANQNGATLSKWKFDVLPHDGENEEVEEEDDDNLDSLDGSVMHTENRLEVPTTTTKESLLGFNSLPQRQSPDGREFSEGDSNILEVSSAKKLFNGDQILTVQLSRKWCSRLGFSIKGSNGHTFVTAIYADSVAGRDGRLHVGDELIMVNNESIRNMETAEVIDLMRKARGIITIALLRKPSGDDEQK